MLALAETSDDPINMIISSPGGHVESGDMVHDMIKFIRPQVRVIGSGWVASGSASDMEIQANQIRHMRLRFEALFARATGQTEARIKADTKRDFWLNTDAALSYGLVGRVIASVTELS